MVTRHEHNSFIEGLRDGAPIALGYLAVSFAFGIASVLAGLSPLEAVLISLFNITSAGQLAGMPIIASCGSLAELVATQLVINSRYSLMSVSLSQKLGPSIKFIDRLIVSYANTDEIFAVAMGKGGYVGKRYMLGLMSLPIAGWTLGTLLGAVAGDVLPELLVTALSVSMYAMFIAIITPRARDSVPTLMAIIAAILLSSLFYFTPVLSDIPDGFTIIIIAVAVSVLFALIFPVDDEDDEGACQENTTSASEGEVAG